MTNNTVPQLSDKDKARFWNSAIKTKECWEWSGVILRTGYGQFNFNHTRELTHRLAFMLSNGPIQKGMMICHKCDNRRCIKPDHLFEGTHADNMRDMAIKGRASQGVTHYAITNPEKLARGSKHGCAKLTEEKVLEIRKAFDGNGRLIKSVADEFGLGKGLVRMIVRRLIWKHIP